jgi:hypothetical protein
MCVCICVYVCVYVCVCVFFPPKQRDLAPLFIICDHLISFALSFSINKLSGAW